METYFLCLDHWMGVRGRVVRRAEFRRTGHDELCSWIPSHLNAPLSGGVFLVGDQLHPIGVLSVLDVRDRDVAHAVGVGCAMPVLDPGRDPHDIAGRNILASLALPLDPALARCDDECLPGRMAVPSRAGAWSEGHQPRREI